MNPWYRAIEETSQGAGLGAAYASSHEARIVIPTQQGSLLKFRMMLNQSICLKLEIDDLAFTELLMNGEVVYEAGNVPLIKLIEEAVRRYEESPRAAIVATMTSNDAEVRLVIHRGRAGIAVMSSLDTTSCIDVLDMYMHLKGDVSIYLAPPDIAGEILEE